MDSPLLDQNPIKPRIVSRKTLVLIALFTILVIIIAGSTTLTSIFNKIRKPNRYALHSSRLYCHLTPHPDLCYSSLSPIINATALKSGPGPIFTSSILVAMNELNNASLSITNINGTQLGPNLSRCQKLIHNSLSRLNESLAVATDNDSYIDSVYYVGMSNVGLWLKASAKSAGRCLKALEEGEEKMGVEEVKKAVEKAKMLILNSSGLFRERMSILFDFYNPYDDISEYYYYDYYSYRYFEYRSLICLYSLIYLFIALLYFMFWRGH